MLEALQINVLRHISTFLWQMNEFKRKKEIDEDKYKIMYMEKKTSNLKSTSKISVDFFIFMSLLPIMIFK